MPNVDITKNTYFSFAVTHQTRHASRANKTEEKGTKVVFDVVVFQAKRLHDYNQHARMLLDKAVPVD